MAKPTSTRVRASTSTDPAGARTGLSRREFLQVSGAGGLSLWAAGLLGSGCEDPAHVPDPSDGGQPDAGVDPPPPVVWEGQHVRHRREAIEDELTGWPRIASATARSPRPVLEYQLCERRCAAPFFDHDY